jgi:hypothetical protein
MTVIDDAHRSSVAPRRGDDIQGCRHDLRLADGSLCRPIGDRVRAAARECHLPPLVADDLTEQVALLDTYSLEAPPSVGPLDPVVDGEQSSGHTSVHGDRVLDAKPLE